MPSLGDRLQHAWNAFRNNRDPTVSYQDAGASYYRRPDRVRYTRGNERSIFASMINRIAIDASQIDIRHVRLDDEGRYLEDVDSGLNDCLTVEANIDQSHSAFKQDTYESILDEGVIAMVPTETTLDPRQTESYDILSMRIGKITEWRPQQVKIQLYNDKTGRKEEIWMNKRNVAIVENPMYPIINEPNSTLKRLVRKLNLLDVIDEQSSSGKMDLIIQLPYVIKSEARKEQAEKRRKAIEDQLMNSKYGIAYTDGTERITQLNRPVENNLMKQIEYLTSMLHSQLGITQSILDGTADEKTMLNYYNRTVQPLVSAVVDEMKRKFLSKTARTKKQTIKYFRDPFQLVPVGELADISDTLTRNEIASSNEMRQVIGWKPSSDPKADELRNRNISQSGTTPKPAANAPQESEEGGKLQNGEV